MPIDKEKRVHAGVVLDIAIYEKVKIIAGKNKRSLSKQIAYWVEQKIEEEEKRSSGSPD